MKTIKEWFGELPSPVRERGRLKMLTGSILILM
jgi:hypothetical protein